jgi:hypothetical protein
MLLRTFLLAGLGAGLVPLASHAQTTFTAPHYYLGVGANLLSNVPFNSVGVPSLVGPALVAGRQLNSRVALQIGASLHWRKESTSDTYLDYGQTMSTTVTRKNKYKYLLVPVVLRYAFKPAAERVQLDGLVGITGILATTHSTYSNSFAGQTSSTESNYGIARASLTLGPAARYALSPTLELTASALVGATIGDFSPSLRQRLFLNVQLGTQYNFG